MKTSMTWALAMGLNSLGASQAAASDLAPVEGTYPTATATDQAAMASSATDGLAMGTAAETAVTSASVASATVSSQGNQASGGGDWAVAFTPYLWIAGTSGDIGIPKGQEVEIDKSFADTLSNLKFAFMGALDVEHRRFVALVDVMYLSVEAEAEGIRDPQFFEGEVDSSVFVGTAALGYRVVDQGPLFVDIVAGGRVVSLDVKVELTGPLTTREREASETKVSPLVGGRVRFPLADNWGVALYGDVSTGGVRWQAIGTVQWDISRHWRLAAGYRHMQIDHDKERLNFDIGLSGPIVGVSYRF